MVLHFPPCKIILCNFLLLLSFRGLNCRRIINHSDGDHMASNMDPSLKVFFTINDLKIGKEIPIYFPNKTKSSNSPHLLPRKESKSIPFSSKNIPYLLKLFSFPQNTPQAKAIKYTLTQCETDPKIKQETKLCVTSLESMLDFVRVTFGLDSPFKALTSNYDHKKVNKEVQKYVITEKPREIMVKKMMISCHVMPYPYVVYYCHSRKQGGNRVFEVNLRGENNEKIEAAAICHMDTSMWDVNHVSFRLLKVKPGSSVCHFLPSDNVIWVPLEANLMD
ncbi:BURP domain-containing protein BNM2A [Euphorbia peplus]|nr:BURP domain-containing protein BNM2A [Euphorbia peplus]